MVAPDQKLRPVEVCPQEGHRPDDAERLYLGGEVNLLRREKSTAIVADGVIPPMGLLLL